MKRRTLWVIPLIIGVLLFLFIGSLGIIMWRIGQIPGMYYRMDPLYPFALLGGPLVSYLSYKKLRGSDEKQPTESDH